MAESIENVQENLARQDRQGAASIRARSIDLEDLLCVNGHNRPITGILVRLTASDTTNRVANLRSKSSLLARQRSEALFTVAMVIF